MATKNKPGKFDCYANAEPDEPMFVLLGRDRNAGLLVRLWADIREAMQEDPAKVAEARACADAMDAWAKSLGKTLVVRHADTIHVEQATRIQDAIELLPHAPLRALDALKGVKQS
jgi:hypothetical protein